MRARWVTAMVAIGALALPASALAGGWATVGMSTTPDGLQPGAPWVVDLEILQHGRTPLDGLEPSVTIVERATGSSTTITARPTGETGHYSARVVFPSAGEWEYVIDDGFSQRHAYPPVRIGEAAAAAPRGGDGGGGAPWLALAAALVVGLAAAGAAVIVQRRGGAAPLEG